MLNFIYLGLENGLQISYSVPNTLHLLSLKYSFANQCTCTFLVFLQNLGLYLFCLYACYIFSFAKPRKFIYSNSDAIIGLLDSRLLSYLSLFVTWASDTLYLMPMAGDLSIGSQFLIVHLIYIYLKEWHHQFELVGSRIKIIQVQ